MPKSPSKKTLAAQAIQRADQADRQFRYQTVTDRNLEAQRAALFSGLGSAQQLSGAYSGAGPARDMSRYSQGLIYENDYLGGMTEAWRHLKSQGVDPRTVQYRHGDSSTTIGVTGAKISSGGGREFRGTMDSYLDENGQPKAGMKGSPFKFDKKTGAAVDRNGDGVFNEADFRSRFSTVGEQAGKGKSGAINMERSWELAGQVVEVQDLFKQANQLAQSGDFEGADAAHAQALQLAEQYGLNEQFDPTGLKGVGKGLTFKVGDLYDPLADPQGGAQQALGSESGMAVGQLLHKARQLQDPNSAETAAFKSALTSGAIAAVDAAHTNALRAMATEERGAQRSMRDMALQSGQASQTARMAAVAARTSERFATQRAGLETQTGAQKAQIYSDAEKLYQSFSVDLTNNAVGLASAWVNDQSGVRDSYRAMHANMMMNYTSNLLGFASNANNNVTQLLMSATQGGGGGGGGAGGILGGALGGAATGAAIGSAIPGIGTAVGAVGGAIIGGVAGA